VAKKTHRAANANRVTTNSWLTTKLPLVISLGTTQQSIDVGCAATVCLGYYRLWSRATVDGVPRLAFVQFGLLGFWGEWHIFYPHSDWTIPSTTKDSVIQWFDNAFSTTPLQNRVPWPAAVTAGLGLHDDSFAHSTLNDTTGWYFWPQVEAAGYTNFWQQNVMGRELRPELQDEAFLDGFPTEGVGSEQDFDMFVDTTHATHHTCSTTTPLAQGKRKQPGWLRCKPRQVAWVTSYQFTVTKVSASVTGDNSVVDIEVEITQAGVAPFYYPLSLSLTCTSGHQWEATGVEAIVGQGDAKAFGFSDPRDASLFGKHGFVFALVARLRWEPSEVCARNRCDRVVFWSPSLVGGCKRSKDLIDS
jgi:hypothetical protein